MGGLASEEKCLKTADQPIEVGQGTAWGTQAEEGGGDGA